MRTLLTTRRSAACRLRQCGTDWRGPSLAEAILACTALWVAACALDLHAANSDVLSLDAIYSSREYAAESFSADWLPDSSGYQCWETSTDTEHGRDLVEYTVEDGARRVVVPARLLIPEGGERPLSVDSASWSDDRKKLLVYTNAQRVWRYKTRGDYWVLDLKRKTLRKLGGDAPPASLMFAAFSPDATRVAYVRDRDLYMEDVQDGTITRLTEKASDQIINGTFDWVYEEELGLRKGFRWSPDGQSVAYWQLDTSGVGEFTMLDNTSSLYPQRIPFHYPKVGQRNSACRVGILDVSSRETWWLPLPGDARNHYPARMEWIPDSSQLIVQQLNRLQNRNRVFLADRESHTLQKLFTERDAAWIDVHDDLRWWHDAQEFSWTSERNGWRHLYLISRDGTRVRRVTRGDFDVHQFLTIDEAGGWCWFLASPENPTQQSLYRCRLDGSQLERVTPASQPGTHTYSVSPNCRWAIHTWSTFERPPVVELVALPGHRIHRTLVDQQALRDKLADLPRHPVEFFRVEIAEGVELDGWCMKPADFDPRRRYPLLVYVYGEPAGRTVRDRWGGSSYLWHLLLTQKGYIVVSMDNRGTRVPRGRAWRKSVYRQIGVLAPQDQAAAVRQLLQDRRYLDPERVGVWGWSGGGSMSLNAIFKYPDLYDAAIAIAPVPDQLYYDTIYQERYMGLPEDNPDGYREGSPIHFAHRLQGRLLIVHGTGDDNCHYQTTELLINELIRHNKQFDMFAYPGRSHSISEGEQTTRHLRGLMTEFLLDALPPGPRGNPDAGAEAADPRATSASPVSAK